MRDKCPRCSGPMKRHGKRRLVARRQCYRDCTSCDYRDKVTIEPERIIRIEPIVRLRTNKAEKH